ncbi:DUF6923 family protein [Lysobacter sp. Hz 25]|uniref:DUF6923 family protein n=1 Tax=Lysobacter sp. Hz 25 TaxID=3383698 RepID=UPI0038D37FB3
MWLGQGPVAGAPSQLTAVNTSTNPFLFTPVGLPTMIYNGMGYNPVDNYIYAMGGATPTNTLVRIGADGSVVSLGPVTGLPPAAYNAGGTTPSGGILYVREGTLNSTLYAINLSTLTATAITLSQPIQSADFAVSGGLIYAVAAGTNTGQLYSINPTTGQVVAIGTPQNTTLFFGSMFGGSTGVYGSANTGGFYKIDVATGGQTLISGSPGAFNNDGAHCPAAAISFGSDLAITKTNTPGVNGNVDQTNDIYTPGTNVVYTIVVRNNGPFGAQNVHVTDPLPVGITTASWTCTGTAGGICTASGTGAINDLTVDLPVGGSVTYLMTVTVPAAFTGPLTNTATVAPGPGTTETTPANNQATDSDDHRPWVTLSKISLGGVGSFGFTGSNGIAAQTLTTAAAGTPVNGARQTLTTAGVATTITEAAVAGYLVTDITCTGMAAGGTATPNLAARTVTLDAAATALGAEIVCTFTNSRQPILRLQKSLPAGRAVASDQFTLQILGPSGGSTITTTGSSNTPTEVAILNPATIGGAHTLSEAGAGATNLAGYTTTYACTNALGGGQTPTGSGTSFNVTPVAGDDLTCTFINTLIPISDLSFSKAVDNAAAAVGTNVTFTLTVNNAGPSDATNVVITDLLPAGYTFVSSAGPGTYTPGTGVWAVGTVVSGASAVRTIVATVNPTGPYVNNAEVTGVDQPDPDSTPGDGTGDDFASVTVTPSVTADIAVAKTLTTAGPYLIGQTVSFDIVVTNNGPSPASNVQVTDTPTNMTVTAVTGACTALPCTIASIAAASSATVTVTGTITADGAFSNSATATLPPGTIDPTPGNNTGTDGGTTTPTADIAVVKTLTTAGPYLVGQAVSYDIVVTNNGPSAATSVQVADTPTNMTVTAVSGACTALPCTIASIAAGASATITVTGTISADGAFSNSATATLPPGTTDPTPGNNTGTDGGTTTPTADIAVVKTLTTAGPYVVGQAVTYDIVVTNNGPSAATSVQVADTPTNMTVTAVSGACTALPCTIASIAAGASATVTVTGTINADGAFSNSATATLPPGTTDPTPGNNTGTDGGTTTPTADIAVVKTLTTAGPYLVGQAVSYDIVVTNNGPSAATSVQVADTPTNMTVTAVSGACTALPCTIASIAAGASATITVTGTISADGAFSNSATATLPPGTTDPTPGNNTGTDGGTTTPTADIAVVKTLTTAGPYVVGQAVTYDIVVTNNGPSAATSVQVADTPTNMTVTAVSGACTALPCTIASIAAGASATITVTGTIGADGAFSNSATATLPPGITDPTPGNNTSTDGGTTTPTADVVTQKTLTTTGVIIAGQTVQYQIVVTNNGPSIATGVVVNDTPTNITITAISGAGCTAFPCTLGSLAVGATATITVTATVGPTGGAFNNSATATLPPGTTDPVPGNNTDDAPATAGAQPISANADNPPAINGGAGGTTPSVLANDTLNGQPVTVGPGGNVALTPGPSPNPNLSMNPDGTITVAPGTPAGTYSYPYTICELANPTNCATAIATVTVDPSDLVANPDDYSAPPINGAGGGTTPSVLSNDTLNGQPVTVGPGGNAVLTPGVSPNPGLTMNPDGTITVAPGTPAGTYTYPYTVCEVINPSNCATTTATVVVSAAPIVAVPDDFSGTPINGSSGGTTPTVISNDTLNGQPITVGAGGNAVLTPGASPNPGLSMNPDGTITVAPGTPAGTYTYPYTVCEVINPSNCATTTATVVVSAAPIVAVPDDFSGTPINGSSGGTTPTVISNDTLNGQPITVGAGGNAVLTPGASPNPGLSMNPDGTITVAPGTPAGTYTYPYTVCEVINPSNCATTTATVVVSAAPIVAVPDDFSGTPINGSSGGTTPTVISNDTLNGQPITVGAGGNAVLTPGASPNPGLSMNPDGTITIAPGTPAGTYTYPYTVCEVLNPSNCATTTATVVVSAAPIVAVPDDFSGTPINGSSGGTTPTVISNDTLNGQPITVGAGGNAVLTPGASPNPGLSMNPDGTITIAPGTPAGTYTYPYTVCEVLNPSNCATTTATVVVSAAPIVAVPDDFSGTPINGSSGGTTPTVISNDTLNGQPITVGAGGNAVLTPGASPNPGLSMNPDGTITIAPGTPAGTYTYPYTVCEVLNPSNCATTTATVVVSAAPIVATPDTATTPQNTPVVTPVLLNDTLNGVPIDPTQVAVTVPTPPANGTVTVNPDGTITYTPNPGFSGTDTYTYQVCETINPSNCATATVTVTVQPNQVTAEDDTASTPANTPVTIPILGNDSTTGSPLNPASITFPTLPANGTVTLNPDGTVTYTPAPGYLGPDTFVYQVCDSSTPTPVCDTATVTVQVTGSPPVANPDGEQVTGVAGEPLIIPVLANDSDPDNNIDPTSILLVGAGGDGKTLVVPGEGTWTVNPNGTLTFMPVPGFVGAVTPIQYTVADTTGLRSNPSTVRATIVGDVQLRVSKTAQPRDVRIGDLVRYTLTIENVGQADAVDAALMDTPPPGFTYVSNSLIVVDRDGGGRQTGTYPIRVDQIDIARGGRATVAYMLRVGAGVRPGVHVNRALMQDNGRTVSNQAQAEVRLVSDPLLDESLLLGTVFDDRDGDGWQDPATLEDLRVQGGFAADAYVPGSTTIDRGDGPQPLADASAPLLHGITVGTLPGRGSEADPAPVVVIAQTLREPKFTDDFALTSGSGTGLRLSADGTGRVERNGRAAKGLHGGAPRVERRISQVEGGVRVEYAVYNDGIDERGIPGVRIASVEGLLIETDPFGRYHLEGVLGGSWERGRNFILKLDPATLPPGTVMTTANPLVRRITPGLPVRFDFGAKLPPGTLDAAPEAVEMRLDEVIFEPGSAVIGAKYQPVIANMAEQVERHRGGEVVIAANGETQTLAYERAKAVREALLAKLPAEQAQSLKVTLRSDLEGGEALATLGDSPRLGTVLFDTGQARIRPQYRSLIEAMAADIERRGSGTVSVVGYADVRGDVASNDRLGLARAKAVQEAIAAKLSPAVRAKLTVRVESDPQAPIVRSQGRTP